MPAGALVLSLACFGCGGGGGGGSGSGTNDGGGESGRDGGGGGGGQDGGGSAADGCKRVDLVISLDNSGSMQEEKEAMVDTVFPAMASRLLEIGGGLEDYRVGIFDACPSPARFHTCDASGDDCGFSSGASWMSSASPDLAGEFSCAADIPSEDANPCPPSSEFECVGDSRDDDEQPALAAVASLEAPESAAGGFNEGFRREDALLVAIAITDEDEQLCGLDCDSGSDNQTLDPADLYDRYVAAVGGDVKRMVFLGVGGGSGGCSQGAYGGAQDASALRELTDRFVAEDRGIYWDLCQGSLEDGLDEAMQIIEEACDELPPIE